MTTECTAPTGDEPWNLTMKCLDLLAYPQANGQDQCIRAEKSI